MFVVLRFLKLNDFFDLWLRLCELQKFGLTERERGKKKHQVERRRERKREKEMINMMGGVVVGPPG